MDAFNRPNYSYVVQSENPIGDENSKNKQERTKAIKEVENHSLTRPRKCYGYYTKEFQSFMPNKTSIITEAYPRERKIKIPMISAIHGKAFLVLRIFKKRLSTHKR
ncbi:hypothetical protein CW304_10730 [Bacillus sp. UFRGS-B20]|nr:hypothetical protein CW304_10730 [Bacillus sp. UFRGS-B20]